MAKLVRWVIENWHLFALFFFVLFWLSLTGSITKGLRNAKDGFREIWNPLGFIVFLVLGIIGFVIYKKITSM